MKCEDFSKKINEYLENTLDVEEKIEMEEHLDSCNLCRNKVDSMNHVFETLSNLDLLCPPSDFTQNVMNAIGKISAKSNSWKKKAYRLWGSSLVAAGLLISIVNISFADANIERHVVNNIVIKSHEINRSIDKEIEKVSNFIDGIFDSLDFYD